MLRCSEGRLALHRKQGRAAMLALSMLAPVDAMRAGLHCTRSAMGSLVEVSSRLHTRVSAS